MTEKEFRKTAFRADTLIEYDNPKMEKVILCSICEVDFDEEILTICPIDSMYYERDKIQVNIKHCKIHDKKIKPIKPLS